MKRRVAVAAAGLLLAACATGPRERPPRFWSGRIGLQVQGQGPEQTPQSLQAAFELQGNAQSGELTLLSPVGSTLARLSWTPQQATLERGSERWSDTNVQTLALQLTQTPLPVLALFDWIEGRPVAPPGWQVDLSGHAQGRILARRALPAPAAQLRIVLDR